MAGPKAIVFVVDDDVSVREGLGSLIRSAGLGVETFASAQEFLARPRSDVPSCLVLDVRLPGLSGLDLQKRMAEANIEIPIIFITGHGDVPTSVQAMKAGAIEFLTKPFRDRDLLDAIHQAIKRDRAARRQHAEMAELYGPVRIADAARARGDGVGGLRACSTNKSPPSWAPARSLSKFIAVKSCKKCRRSLWRIWSGCVRS